MLRQLLVSTAAAFAAMVVAAPAVALDNDLKLSRLAEFNPQQFGTDCDNACGIVEPDRELFKGLVSDFGQVLAPRLANPAETLGEAGFAFNMMTSWSIVDDTEDHWIALEDGNAEPVFFTGHLQVRKGLPFSFEVAGNMAYLFNSEMFTLGADVKWALNEGFEYIPDLALRGTVNTLMGSRDLNLYTAGGDISVSKAFGIAGIMVVTPYLGAQGLWIIGSSRLLNAYPQDPRPPQFDDNPNPLNETFSPEFVFSQYTTNVYRFFVGTRFNVWILNLVVEGVIADIPQITLAGGVDF